MRCALVSLLMVLATPAHAQTPERAEASRSGPLVLFDGGGTVPITGYLKDLDQKVPAPAPAPPSSVRLPRSGNWLPVTTQNMSPGRVAPQSLARLNALPRRPGMRPLFLVGADDFSLRWLAANAGVLAEMSAVGMVIEAKDEAELGLVRRAAGGLPLFAASAADIGRELSIRHYPVLITPDGIWQ